MELKRPAAVLLTQKSRALRRLTFVVVVARRAFALKALSVYRLAPNRRYPFGLGFGRGFKAARFQLLRLLDYFADVPCLLFEHMRKVRGQAILRQAHMEAVRKTGTVETV